MILQLTYIHCIARGNEVPNIIWLFHLTIVLSGLRFYPFGIFKLFLEMSKCQKFFFFLRMVEWYAGRLKKNFCRISWIPCCDVYCDFCIKTMFGSSLSPVVCRRTRILFTLFVFVCVLSGVQHILCFVFLFFFVFILCTLCCQFLWNVHVLLTLMFTNSRSTYKSFHTFIYFPSLNKLEKNSSFGTLFKLKFLYTWFHFIQE